MYSHLPWLGSKNEFRHLLLKSLTELLISYSSGLAYQQLCDVLFFSMNKYSQYRIPLLRNELAKWLYFNREWKFYVYRTCHEVEYYSQNDHKDKLLYIFIHSIRLEQGNHSVQNKER
jgi:hypothetical protein